MNDKRYLFVSGCPRSGTTVLGHLLNWSDDCFIGLERFGMLFDRNFELFTPELFHKERFLDHRKGDCPFSSLNENSEYLRWYANRNALAAAGGTSTVGDKIVSLWSNFPVFNRSCWDDTKISIFHITRDVGDVAASYKRRHDDPQDAWSNDLEAGVRTWCSSVETTFDFLTSGSFKAESHSLHLISYENLRFEEPIAFVEDCSAIYKLAGLSFSSSTEAGLGKLVVNAEQRKNARGHTEELKEHALSLVPVATMEKYHHLHRNSIL